MIIRWPESRGARRAVVAISLAACGLLFVHYWRRWQDIQVTMQGARELEWRGLRVSAPLGYTLVPDSRRGILAFVTASGSDVERTREGMGLQDVTVRGDSPYEGLQRRCRTRGGCEEIVDSVLPFVTCLKARVSKQYVAACQARNSAVEGYYIGPDSLVPMFVRLFKKAHTRS